MAFEGQSTKFVIFYNKRVATWLTVTINLVVCLLPFVVVVFFSFVFLY